jgi:pyruvate/2-oxoglutarate dehydrogenase complex dihydrolipoamide dehydrogenase (E3) component
LRRLVEASCTPIFGKAAIAASPDAQSLPAAFIDPQLGRIGLSEKEAKEQGKISTRSEAADDHGSAGN